GCCASKTRHQRLRVVGAERTGTQVDDPRLRVQKPRVGIEIRRQHDYGLVIPGQALDTGDVRRRGGPALIFGTTHSLVYEFTDQRKYASGGILNPALAVPHDPAVPRCDVPVFGSVTLHER